MEHSFTHWIHFYNTGRHEHPRGITAEEAAIGLHANDKETPSGPDRLQDNTEGCSDWLMRVKGTPAGTLEGHTYGSAQNSALCSLVLRDQEQGKGPPQAELGG